MVKKTIQHPRRGGKISIVNMALRQIGVDLGKGIDRTIISELSNTQEHGTSLAFESLERAREMLNALAVQDYGPLDHGGFRSAYHERIRMQMDAVRRDKEIFHRYCLTQIMTEIRELSNGGCDVHMNLFDYHHFTFHMSREVRNTHDFVGHIYEEKQRQLTMAAYEHSETRQRVFLMIQRHEEFRHMESRVNHTMMQAMNDMMVYGRGFFGWGDDTRKKPEQEEKYPCGLAPERITSDCGRFTAERMSTNIRLWEESDAMRNCIYRSYRHKIKARKYLAYHVSAPHLGFRSGFTFGFDTRGEERLRVKMVDRMTNEIIVRTEWRCEQIKGKANSRCDDRELQEFGNEIAIRLTKAHTRYETHQEMPRGFCNGKA